MKTRSRFALLSTLPASLLLAGCAAVLGPDAVPPAKPAASFFAPYHYADASFDAESSGLKFGVLDDAGRAFVVRWVGKVDRNYAAYTSWLSSGRASTEVTYESVGLAATGVSAISTVTSVKTGLAAIGMFAQGQKASIDKNYYQGKLIFTLINVMEVSRTDIRGRLRRALDSPSYTMQQALLDIEEYYRAGTIDTALSSTSINTAAELSSPPAAAAAASKPDGAASAVVSAEAAATAASQAAGAAAAAAEQSAAVRRLAQPGLSVGQRTQLSSAVSKASELANKASAQAKLATQSAADARAVAGAAEGAAAPAAPAAPAARRLRYPSTSPY